MADAPVEMFGKTRMLPVRVYVDARPVSGDDYTTSLWVERPEDWYAFEDMKGQRVRVVTREDWLRAERKEQTRG